MHNATNLPAPVLGAAETFALDRLSRVAPGAVTVRQRLMLGAVLVLLACVFQGSRALYETDEGRYTDVALAMLESHDWLVPHVDHERAIFTKPPLAYWSLAASFSAFGRNEWAARLPNAIAFVATGFLVLGLARRFVPTHPWLGSAAWAAMLGPTVAANVVSTDTLLALWETLAMYAWVSAATAPRPAHRRWIVVMWLAWGLAMLTKGPVGLLPLVALLCALAGARDTSALRSVFSPIGLTCFAVVGLGWYIGLIAARPELAAYFLGYETYDRVFTSVHGRNAEWYGAFAVYVPTLIIGTLPWTVLLPRRRIARTGVSARSTRDADHALLKWWLLLPLAVFALSRSRLPLYVLPLFVPLALLIARSLAAEASRFRPRPILRAGSAWLLVLIALKGVAAHYPAHSKYDARSFASQLSRAVPLRDFDDIVFVDTLPVYGLRLYVGHDIEQIAMQPKATPFASFTAPQGICDELREHERAVYLVRGEASRGRFEQALRACGAFGAIAIGRIGDFGAFKVEDARLAGASHRRGHARLASLPAAPSRPI